MGGGGVQNALFKIATKQCLSLLMMLDFDALQMNGRTDEQTNNAKSRVALRLINNDGWLHN